MDIITRGRCSSRLESLTRERRPSAKSKRTTASFLTLAPKTCSGVDGGEPPCAARGGGWPHHPGCLSASKSQGYAERSLPLARKLHGKVLRDRHERGLCPVRLGRLPAGA